MSNALCTLLLVVPPSSPQAQYQIATAPPGLVRIEGGTTYVGTDPSEIQQILDAAPSYDANLRPLDGETPQYRETVPTFYMGLTELTNEQYAPFVQASGYRPPFEWADPEASQKANLAWQKAEQEKYEAAKAEGRRYDRKPFEPEKWWEGAWKDHPWAVPANLLLVPVVRVACVDAEAYCRWAGLRLPTEFEFQRAVRRDSKHPWPWGDKWEKGKRYAATQEIPGLNSPMPVGSFPEGSTPEGLHDLIGNVWEWTDSKYMPLKGFKENEYKIGKDKLKKLAIWDANKRVTVGGSYLMHQYVSRASVRAEAGRTDRRDALGFRPAAGLHAGEDIARVLNESDVRLSDARPDGIAFLPEAVVALDHWRVTDSTSDKAPAGYKVIQGYDYILFVPVDKLQESQDAGFARDSLVAPHPLGYLACSMPMLEPALAPGVYFVSYRAKGEPPRERADQGQAQNQAQDPLVAGPAIETLIDMGRDNFIFTSAATGEFAGALPVGLAKFDKAEGAGAFNFIDHTIWETVTDAQGEEQRIQKVEKRLALDVGIPSPIRSRVLKLNMVLNAPPDMAGQAWRRE